MAFEIQSTTERLESVAGLALAGEIAKKCGLSKLAGDNQALNNVLSGMFGLLVQGRSSYEEIDLYRGNDFFRTALGVSYVPARETLRLHLEKIAATPRILDRTRSCNTEILKRTTISPVTVDGRNYIPIDVDVSTLDNGGSHKEGVSRTYMGTDGYAPIFSYIGAEGSMLDCELRPGSQHCQKGTPEFLKRNLLILENLSLKHPLLFRLDSGNDAVDTIRPLLGKDRFFLIKRNPRRERREDWLELAQTLGVQRLVRPGKTTYTGTITKSHPKADADMPEFDIVFQITERTIDRDGNFLLVPEIEIETWWTNLFESAEDCIALYHDHGTSEQYHSELKSDMGVERLPSGKMQVNALILNLAMIAFNTLRLIGQRALAKENLLPVQNQVKRKRLRKVISDLINIGCKLVRHGRKWILRISQNNPWLPVFRELYADFQTL